MGTSVYMYSDEKGDGYGDHLFKISSYPHEYWESCYKKYDSTDGEIYPVSILKDFITFLENFKFVRDHFPEALESKHPHEAILHNTQWTDEAIKNCKKARYEAKILELENKKSWIKFV